MHTVAGALLLTALQCNAGVLLPDKSLFGVKDLTIVRDGNTILQYLDLTATYGMTTTAAQSTYSAYGFRWADSRDMSVLLSAFDVKYSIAPGGVSSLQRLSGGTWDYDTFTTATQTFLDRVGYDPSGAISGAIYAAGFINDMPTPGRSTYMYINRNAGLAFVSNEQTLFQAAGVGTFLVRSVSAVPEPNGWMLALLGCAVLVIRRVSAREKQ